MLMQENTMKPTFGSLFAGVGGFDMGMEQAGWECKFQVEWDKHCQHILNKHWPDIPKWGDVSTVSGTEIPPVDCIIFGSPCQDLSVAGKRAGLQGERSGLFYEAVRIIKEMRHVTNGTFPRWAIWENVAGALSSNNGRDFAAVISEMAEAGAVLQEYALLDAQHFGIPQRRRRVFLVACFDPAIARNCPDPLLPVSESLRGNTAKGKSKGQVASSETSAGFGSGSFGGWSETDTAITLSARDHKSSNTIIGSLAARDYKGVGSQYVDEGKVIVEPMLLDGTRVDDVRVYEPPVQTLKERMGTGGNNVPMLAEQVSVYDGYNQKLDNSGIHRSLRIGRDSSDFIAQPTEPTMAVRRLTPLECERLMGWPDDHTRWKADGTEQADTHRYKQCGNGVASPVAKWIAQHILKAHQ